MDLGRSGAYNDVSDNTRTFITDQSYSQQRDGERFSNEIEMNERESGAYSRFIGSFKQSLNDHHQGSASMYTGKSIKHDDEHIFETELKTPDSGTYSRNIGSYGDRTTNTYGQSHYNGTIENHDFTRGSKYERRIHESGIHKTQVGSIRDISDTEGRMETHQQRNYDHESQPRSNKFFQPSKYVGNTLDTPFEQDEDPPAKSVDFFGQSNPTQPYTSKSKNNGTATSTSDYDGNDAPHWATMMYDTEFTDGYLKQKWPRVNLQSSKYQSSGPFVVQNDDDNSKNEVLSNNKNDTGKRTRNTCCVICFGIVLLILVVVPIIVITTLKEDNTGTTEYYKVSMNLSVDQQFLPAHNDTQSTEYKDFTRDFCAEIDKVYKSTTDGLGSNYHGCNVTRLQNGSIEVDFSLYIVGLNVNKVYISSKLNSSLENNNQSLGSFKVKGGRFQVVSVDKIPALPASTTIPPKTTSTQVTTSTMTTVKVDTTSEITSTSTAIDPTTTTNEITSTKTTMDPTTETDDTTSTTTAIDPTTTTNEITSTKTTMDTTTETDDTTSTTTTDETNSTTTAIMDTTTRNSETSSTTTTMDPTTVTDETTSTTTDEATSTTATMDPTTTVEASSNRFAFADMKVTLNTTYSSDLNDTSSDEYASFTKDFCSEINTAYSNETGGFGDDYYGCDVTDITEGSIVVNFRIYCINTTNIQLTMEAQSVTILNTHTSNGFTLGDVNIIVVVVELIKVDIAIYPGNPPIITTPYVTTNTTTETTDGTLQTTTGYTVSPEDVGCQDSTFIIGNRAIYTCSLTVTEFDEIIIVKLSDNSVTLATIFMNGTITYVTQVDANITYVAGEKVELTFSNISCFDEGTYEITVRRNFDVRTSKGNITVQRQPSAPRLTMHEDQVIDLQFYREDSENECKAEVGNPPGYLVIEVQNGNSTDYDEIPSIDITYVKNTTTSGDCSNTQLLRFGMNYTSDMDNGKIRCRVESNVGDEMMSVEKDLLLIPRDICSCNNVNAGVKRGHPKRCHVYVECIERDYPTGVLCHRNECRNSIDGTCSSNCSDAVCEETVPQSFCTTPPPSTTTPAPSPHISCNDSISVLLYSGSVTIVCVLNQTATFDLINVTKISTSDSRGEIAQISNDGDVIQISAGDNIDVTYTTGVITITVSNASCSDGGVFRVAALLGDELAIAQTAVTIHRKPSTPQLTMHADQVIDLQFYRRYSENECEAEVGNPPGYLVIEVQNGNSTDYDEIPSIDITYVDNITTSGDCSNTQLLKFGMNYTSDMDNGKIRCRVESNLGDEMMSVEKDLLLIPRDICSCNNVNQGVKRGHPKRCDVYVECRARDYPAGVLCPVNECRNSIDGTCGNCSVTDCEEDVPQSFCTTPQPSTTTPAPSPHISCNDTMSVLLYSGPVTIVCVLNQTATFDLINVTKISTSDKEEIAQISNEGNLIQISADDNIVVMYTTSYITITVNNVNCSDEGVFRVAALFGDELAIAQTAITIHRRPSGLAELKLNADQIADLRPYRSILHYCEADTGYPGGELQIEILLEGENEFKIFNETQDVDVTDSTENCIGLRRITFGIFFTSDMNGAIIRCGVTNGIFGDDVLAYSNNETVSLIPNDFCLQNTEERSFHQHPTDCTKFVQCEGTTTYGKSCPADLCFGIDTVNACDYCDSVVCSRPTTQDPDITTQQSGTTLSENSMITLKDMNCTTISTFIGSGPADITCTFKLTDVLIGINVSKKVDSTDSLLATINSNGNLISTPPSGIEIKYTDSDLSTISLEIATMTCADEGNYMFIANQQGNVTFNGGGSLVAKAKPDKPVLTLTHYTVENEMSPPSVCKGNVGNPQGSIYIEVKRANEVNYSKYEGFQTSSIKTPNAECNTSIELKFSHVFTEEWNNTKIRCRVENDETINDEDELNDYISDEDTIILIKDDYCDGDKEYKQHPRGNCAYYVRCVNEKIYSKKCPGTLCFDGQLITCTYCVNVNATFCNFA